VILSCFFFTGACGLIYEVVWMRLLRLVMGNSTFAITTVVCAFMAGLALGSYFGGRLADRRSDWLRIFAGLQAGIALYCFALPWLIAAAAPIYQALYRNTQTAFYVFSLVRFLFSLLILLVPATLMGATLPVLSRYFVRMPNRIGWSVGGLYAVNTFGAVVGAFVAGFVLIPVFGVSKTIYLACALSAAAAAASYWSSRRARSGPPLSAAALEAVGAGRVRLRRGAIWMLLAGYCVAGAAAMIYQIAWARVLSLLIGSSVYAFSLLLTGFILGLALGSLVLSSFVDRLRHALFALGLVEIAVGWSALMVVPFMDELPVWVAGVIVRNLGSFWQLQVAQFGVVLLIVLAPATLMGAAFPLVNRLVVENSAGVGRAVGVAYSWNTVGCIAGSFVCGFVLIPWLGIERAITTAVLLNVATGIVWLAASRSCRLQTRFVSGLVVCLVTAAWVRVTPSWDPGQMSLGPFVLAMRERNAVLGSPSALADVSKVRPVLFHKDGLSATITVKQEADQLSLYVDGKADASSVSDLPTQLLLAHVPMLLHPAPRDVLVIGLASGITLGSASRYPEVRALDCAEIEPHMVKACRFFDEHNYRVLDDPRVRILAEDGRNHLALTDKTYDVITSEPSNPWIAGIADLFTREFFRLCRDRLNDGGVVCVWLEAYTLDAEMFNSVVNSFRSVFPKMSIWSPGSSDYLMVGFKGEPRLSLLGQAGRLQGDVAKDLERINVRSVPDLFAYMAMGSAGAARLAQGAPLHTDDRPLLEFGAPRTMYQSDGGLSVWESVIAHGKADLSELVFAGDNSAEAAALSAEAERFMAARTRVSKALLLKERGAPNEERVAELQAAAALNNNDPWLREMLTDLLQRGAAAAKSNEVQTAMQYYLGLADIDPKLPDAQFELGMLLGREGRSDAAAERLKEAVRLWPNNIRYRFELAKLQERLGNISDAVQHYREALRVDPTSAVIMNNLAWILATCTDPAVRDAKEALRLATRACELTGYTDVHILDTLAAAYANDGQFPMARAIVDRALSTASTTGNRPMIDVLYSRSVLYAAEVPYREMRNTGSSQTGNR
jgi:spermidine synthase